MSWFRSISRLLSVAGCSAIIVAAQTKPPRTAVAGDFQRDIRPILSDACFHCHGPDKNTRMVGLRLDTRDGAFDERKTGIPIVPGKPEQSLVYQRITHAKKGLRMPPESSHKTLTPKQIETIRAWIANGAPWEEHWAFTAPVRPKPPAVVNRAWVENPIDQFILARLQKEGLSVAPAADRRTLIRRISLDLTGLPPTPEEVDAFVKDKSPKAYEKVVDRLLSSPHWGEHRGRYWLDAARYADTHGLHIDNYREMWPYRDWVINAFNRNLSFDQFTIEQIAGDLLPNPTMDQLIATGFHRCNVTTNEGGVIPEEVAAMYAKDRADTTGTVFLGLTVGCATCHDHKFDPITQKDFYSLTAFFRNTSQDPLDGNVYDTPPVLVVPKEEDLPRWRQIAVEEKALNTRRAEVRGASEPEFNKWLEEEDKRVDIPGPVEPADEVLSVTSTPSRGVVFSGKAVSLSLPEGIAPGEGHIEGQKAIRFQGKSFIELPNMPDMRMENPFTIAAWFYLPQNEGDVVIVSQTDPDSKNRGWAFEVNARLPTLRLTTGSTTLQVRPRNTERLKPGTWNHVAFSYDGSREVAGLRMFVNGRETYAEKRTNERTIEGDFRTWAPLRIGSDGKRKYYDGGAIAELRIFTKPLTEEEVELVSLWPALNSARSKRAEELTEAERRGFLLYFLNRDYGRYQSIVKEDLDLEKERRAIASRGALTHIQQERKDQKPFAHILNRGLYDQPKEKVDPAAPSALPPLPASYPQNRLGLAKWLVDENNPLTARVAVNRFWQEVFGNGLVRSADDFGSQGEPPSHPQLLDWLAVEFRESGWDVKKLFRLMVTSAAYRQSAAVTPAKIQKDPNNRLLSRGPRFRMDAEMVRDYALATSGLLVPKIGGPSVKPYQPEGIWEAVAMNESNTRFYKRDVGDKLYRRSLYTFWKRSAPPASMDLFNAPTREGCTVNRERTNTPLQALVTMNGDQFIEAARHLAGDALRHADTFDERLDYLTARALGRSFGIKERAVAKKALDDYVAHYAGDVRDAGLLITTGESIPDSSLGKAELAAYTMLANQILNLDEVLNK